MSVVISSSLVLTEVDSGGGVINANNPIIGYENLLSVAEITTTTAATDYPATNMENVSTYLRWQGVVSSPTQDEYVTITFDEDQSIDYIGLAKHNFFTAQIPVSIEILDTSVSPNTWTEVIADSIPSSDGPLIFRFTEQVVSSIRIRMQPGSAAPYIGVLYVGKLLVLQRRIYVGHTPIVYGVTTKATNGMSESGNFLGRIVLNRMTSTKINMANLTPSWYRTYLDPFVVNSQENPFFFAWRPSDYPTEVGFAWVTNDPQPKNQLPNGMMDISFDLNGIFE